MLFLLIVACGVLVLSIVAVVTSYWNDIILLPDSAAAFLGALAGAGGGLFAIILGALINAELNRRRDDRLHANEALALTRALASEMRAIGVVAQRHAVFLRGLVGGAPVQMFVLLEPPRANVFASNADKIGWIVDAARDEIFATIIASEKIAATIHTFVSGPPEIEISVRSCANIAAQFDALAETAEGAAKALRDAELRV